MYSNKIRILLTSEDIGADTILNAFKCAHIWIVCFTFPNNAIYGCYHLFGKHFVNVAQIEIENFFWCAPPSHFYMCVWSKRDVICNYTLILTWLSTESRKIVCVYVASCGSQSFVNFTSIAITASQSLFIMKWLLGYCQITTCLQTMTVYGILHRKSSILAGHWAFIQHPSAGICIWIAFDMFYMYTDSMHWILNGLYHKIQGEICLKSNWTVM